MRAAPRMNRNPAAAPTARVMGPPARPACRKELNLRREGRGMVGRQGRLVGNTFKDASQNKILGGDMLAAAAWPALGLGLEGGRCTRT